MLFRLLSFAVLIQGLFAATLLADTSFPKPMTLDTNQPGAQPFILAGPDTQSVIITGDADPAKYRFPYWGGHLILQRYLEVITGVKVPIIDHKAWPGHPLNKPGVYRIWMGTKNPAVREAIGSVLDRIDADGFVIKAVAGQDLYISGAHYWGTHFAPYDLLERAAGCRWYLEPPRFWLPAEDGKVGLGDVIPQAARVAIPGNTFIVEEPSYRMRWFRIVPQHSFRVHYRDKFHHALLNIFPPATLGKDHPELFPLIDGKRFVPPSGRAHDFQPCISNPQSVEIVVAAARKAFDRGDLSFSIGMNDSGKYCQCDACRAIAPASIQGDNARIAYAYFAWYNQIAEKLHAEYPDRRLGCLAYGILSQLPSGAIKLHPMIVPYLTRDSAQLFDPHEQAEFRETVNRWKSLSERMGIYEYIYGQGFYIPRMYGRYLYTNIKNRYGVGVDGFYAEAYPQWSLDGPKYWITAKLLWDHTYDVDSLVDDYMANMFGPAARQMRAYFDFLEEVWCTQTLESKKSNYRWMNDPEQLAIFSPSQIDQAVSLIDAAYADSQGIYRDRIAFFRRGILFTKRLSQRYNFANAIAQADDQAQPSAEAMKALSGWIGTGTIGEIYNLRSAAGLDQTSHVSLSSFAYLWDRNSAPMQLIHDLSQDLTTRAMAAIDGRRSLEAYRQAVDGLLENPKDVAWSVVGDVARESGILFVREGRHKPAPVIDGRIMADEWGEPSWRGRFHEVYQLFGRSGHVTTIYARDMGDGKLHLAFDCEADVKVMGADVRDISDDRRYPLKMRHDDAIVINIKPSPDAPIQTYRVNVDGVWESPRQAGFEVATSRTEKGWQVEMVITNKLVTPEANAGDEPVSFAIARYERRQAQGDKPFIAYCTTFRPVTRKIKGGRGFVGYGNHDKLMAFAWGTRLLHEHVPSPSVAGQNDAP